MNLKTKSRVARAEFIFPVKLISGVGKSSLNDRMFPDEEFSMFVHGNFIEINLRGEEFIAPMTNVKVIKLSKQES